MLKYFITHGDKSLVHENRGTLYAFLCDCSTLIFQSQIVNLDSMRKFPGQWLRKRLENWDKIFVRSHTDCGGKKFFGLTFRPSLRIGFFVSHLTQNFSHTFIPISVVSTSN